MNRTALLCVCVAMLTSCANAPWYKFGGNDANNGRAVASSATGLTAWQKPTGLAIWSNPVLDSHGTVYATSTDGSAYAFNGVTGAPIWSRPIGAAIRSTPAVQDGMLYFGADDKKVYRLDAATGSILSQCLVGDRVVAGVAPAGTVVYVPSLDHTLYAMEMSTCTVKWHVDTGGELHSSPAQSPNGTVYFGSDDHLLYAVNAGSGTGGWTYRAGGAITAAPAVGAGDTVFFGSDDGYFHGLDSQGHELWPPINAGGGSWAPAAVIFMGGPDNKEIVYIANRSVLAAINAHTGAFIWTTPNWYAAQYVSQPAVVPGGLFFISVQSPFSGASLFAADSKTGAMKWVWPAGTAALNSPAVGLDGKVYVTSFDGNVYAIH